MWSKRATEKWHWRTNHLPRSKIVFTKLVIIFSFMLGWGMLMSNYTTHAAVGKVLTMHTVKEYVAKPQPKPISRPPQADEQVEFINNIDSLLASTHGFNFEISVENLNNKSVLNFGPSTPMISASVSKILTAADFLKLAELGKENLNEILSDGQSASYALRQMITISSDTAWESLNDKVTYPQLQNYADSLGLTSYNYIYNTLSAADTVKLYADLYSGDLLDPIDTSLVLSYMKVANFRNYIVAAVPATDIVYHKIGIWNGELNDAAIITNNKTSVVMAIYSLATGPDSNPAVLPSIFQQITKLVLAYNNLL